ncbi:hypothetical protein I4U23_016164 [Adineta vaga]|nr:hypothetical protein I4U23_016164 [Adineta vaga]
MKLFELVIFLVSFLICYTRYTFYHTNNQQGLEAKFDCLYSYILYTNEISDGSYLMFYHLIPYCRQFNEHEESISISYENVENQISFKELYRQGITSSQLLDWFAPIDIAEDYEINGNNSNKYFYNCSLSWFGSTCQFRIINIHRPLFGQLVRQFFLSRTSPSSHLKFNVGSCYPFLNTCIRAPSPMCLDWREICNGIVDCVNGEDEELCYLLERNQCSENEFHCTKSKECIPEIFVKELESSYDCLDGSDESGQYGLPTGEICMRFPTFECEEIARRTSLYDFSCGDGQIIEQFIPSFSPLCKNLRDKQMTIAMFTSFDYISNLACRQYLICLIRRDQINFLTYLQNETYCQIPFEYCPSKWLVFPEYPMIYSFFQFVYLTNRSISPAIDDVTPDFVCFNATRCRKYLFCSIDIGMYNGLHCCHTMDITNVKIIDMWYTLQNIFEEIFLGCFETIRNENTNSSNLRNINVTEYWINSNKKFSFSYFCDTFQRIYDNIETNDTDETDCHLWPCNNPYSRCNKRLNCLNGFDEINCSYNLCLSNELICEDEHIEYNGVSYCLSVSYLADDYTKFNLSKIPYRFIYLINETKGDIKNYLFWNETKCITVEYHNQTYFLVGNNNDICLMTSYRQNDIPAYINYQISRGSEPFCTLLSSSDEIIEERSFLQSSRLGYFPSIIHKDSHRSNIIQLNERITNDIERHDFQYWYCNRGFPFLYQNKQTITCLCPPSYFGSRCQWQSQRISLTIQLKYFSFTHEMPIFQIIIMLIDDQGQITLYHEQITYVPKRDCGIKYHFYLLYPHRPKNSSINYSIRIDIFNKITLTYWASWYFSILFPFLPINRIATHILIPLNSQQTESSCPLSCGIHGKCIKYYNRNSSYFCQCTSGYSGFNCQIKHHCSCSSDSFCLSSSICICPLYQFGSQCYLKHTICQSSTNPCQNHGQCIPVDDRIALKNFTCTCKEGFLGERCENIQNRIDIEFPKKLITTISSVLIHLITIYETSNHLQNTLLKQIKYGENSVTMMTTNPFHLVFLEVFHGDFYLIVKREQFIQSESIQTKVLSNYQCMFVNKLLNDTLKSSHYLHRIKYYPLLCRQNKDLRCFYDEIYMCVCDQDRFSNCLTFNRTTTYDCNQRENPCQNHGKCFLTNQTCSSTIQCLCTDCFYGTKCQFTTEGFVLSLDYILSYHIKPNLSLFRQPIIVRMSIFFITILFLIGFLSGSLSIITFRVKKTRTTGCGFYLLVSGWISIIIILILIIKFIQLILSQMKIFNNFSILYWNCILLDMSIKVLLAINDWLDGCISIERVVTVKQGVKFNKIKSKKIAKCITIMICLISILTHLHDAFYRQLIEDIDIDEKRIWCIVQYVYSIKIYNSFITLFHFLVPFTINLFSGIIIIFTLARNRSTIQPKLSYFEHLKLQFIQHKHHLIASFSLVLLGLPRLIISFISGCMKSPQNSWVFLCAYFISFLPSSMTFIVYVLPSKTYKDEFNIIVQQTLRRFRNLI